MKKVCSLLVALLIALTALSAMADTTFTVEGTWYLNAIKPGEIELDPALSGITEMSTALNADGTFVSTMNGEPEASGTWVLENNTLTTTFGDGSSRVRAFTLVGEELQYDAGGVIMVFGKEKKVYETYVPSPIRTDVALADFIGTWVSTHVDVNGIHLAVETYSKMQYTFDITEEGVTLDYFDGEQITETCTGTYELKDNKLELTFDLAQLIPAGEADATDDPAATAVPEMIMKISLVAREDGTLSYDSNNGNQLGTTYLQKQVEE